MKTLKHLFENNRRWADEMRGQDAAFFDDLANLQSPEYLWIGCSDSRVPANQLLGLLPGEIFVHRNVANIVVHSDLNCLSVIQYAVDVLKVKHIIVCGHYGCGGVHSALHQHKHGLIDNWLHHIEDIYAYHQSDFEGFNDAQKWEKLCELNVITQAANVAQTTIVRDAWERGQELAIHGWIYSLKDGLLRDLGMCASSGQEMQRNLDTALAKTLSAR